MRTIGLYTVDDVAWFCEIHAERVPVEGIDQQTAGVGLVSPTEHTALFLPHGLFPLVREFLCMHALYAGKVGLLEDMRKNVKESESRGGTCRPIVY